MQHVEEAGNPTPASSAWALSRPHSLGQEMLQQKRAATCEIALLIAWSARSMCSTPSTRRAVRDPGQPAPSGLSRSTLRRSAAARSSPAGSRRASRSAWGLPGSHGLASASMYRVRRRCSVHRFEGADSPLGPEMRSSGEATGIARNFPMAFAKAQAAAGLPPPNGGPPSSLSPTPTRTAPLGDRADPARQRLSHPRHARHRRRDRRMGVRAQALNKIGEGSPTSSTGSSAAT